MKNTKINLSSLHAGGVATANVIIDKVNSISATSKNLKVSSITFDNFVSTGVANQYTAELTVSITGSVRQLKPIILKNLITTIPNGPGSEKITGCLGVGNAGAISSLDNLPKGAIAGYCIQQGFQGVYAIKSAILPAKKIPTPALTCICIPGWSRLKMGEEPGGGPVPVPDIFYSCVKN